MLTRFKSLAVLCLTLGGLALAAIAADSVTKKEETKKAEPVPAKTDEDGLRRLSPDGDVWLDKANKRLVLDSTVSLTDGKLEMFACLKSTKEHESILSVKTKAFVVHAGLLALGAKVGGTVKFDPVYVPASGTEIEITLEWTDKDGKRHTARGQDWVRHDKTKKPMTDKWVFAGSMYWTDDEGVKHYAAETGDFICVSNFPSAMLDLPIESTQTNDELLFSANTEKIPPKGTKVRMYLTPKLEKSGAKDAKTEKDAKDAKDAKK